MEDPAPAAAHATAPMVVFVYGTLRPGRANWRVAAPHCIRTEPATMSGFALYALDHPCVVELQADDPARASSAVQGDLLWLDPARSERALERLDAFEGYVAADPDRSYYHRLIRTARTADQEMVPAWIYVPGPDLLAQVSADRRVPGDDWPP